MGSTSTPEYDKAEPNVGTLKLLDDRNYHKLIELLTEMRKPLKHKGNVLEVK